MIHTSQQAFIISNPMAGGNQARAIKQLQSLGLPFELTETKAAGHAEALALQASQDGYRFIIALGGDGTIHEVVNGMLRNPCNQSTLGWIPSGTANDYAASFSCDLLKSLDKSPACVDVGCVRWNNNSRYFANVAGIGLSGAVATCARSLSRLPARIKYSLSLLSQLGSNYGTRDLSICIDKETTQPAQEVLLLSVAIGSREGSFTLHPDADVTDGLFDVLQLGPLSRWALAWHFQALQRGILPTKHPQIHRTRCRRIEINSAFPIPIHLDGECPGEFHAQELKHLTLEVIPQALPCFATPRIAPIHKASNGNLLSDCCR